MKKFSFLVMAAAGMLFAACSSDKDVADNSGTSPLDRAAAGYFKVNLNLPTNIVNSTKAAGWGETTTGNLDDGLEKEYAVNSVLLLIFEGANESAATLKQVITPTEKTSSTPGDNPNHITTNREYTAKLNSTPTNNLYALAVVNGTGIIEGGSDDTKVKIGGGTETSGITLAALQAATSQPFINSDKFFMTNAVLSTVKGGASDPTANPTLQTLAQIDPGFIYETETAAASGKPAVDIYVERGVAKVTLNTSGLGVSGLAPKGGGTVTASFQGWALDNTQNKSYIVRKVPSTFTWNLTSKEAITTDKYRFVGGNAVDAFYGSANLFRTYWAEDPTYNTFTAADFTTVASPSLTTSVGNENPLYCYENTFDVANQTYQSTTRAIIKVNLNSSTDFYTIGADRKTLYSLDNVKDLVKTDLMNQSDFATWWATQSTLTLTGADLTVSFSSTDAGVITVTDVTVNKSKCDKTSPATDPSVNTAVAGAIAALNTALAKVEYFKGGDVYYAIRIKHFGDDLTPWNSTEWETGYKPAESTIATIYPDASDGRQNANYLGRYGMVRNNWYDLVLGNIVKIGSSTVPTVSGETHPDDDLDESYIKARINILSWAKRTQNWNLK